MVAVLLHDRPPTACPAVPPARSAQGPRESKCDTDTGRAGTFAVGPPRRRPLPALGQARSACSDLRECLSAMTACIQTGPGRTMPPAAGWSTCQLRFSGTRLFGTESVHVAYSRHLQADTGAEDRAVCGAGEVPCVTRPAVAPAVFARVHQSVGAGGEVVDGLGR